jgi:hypothetical protein
MKNISNGRVLFLEIPEKYDTVEHLSSTMSLKDRKIKI